MENRGTILQSCKLIPLHSSTYREGECVEKTEEKLIFSCFNFSFSFYFLLSLVLASPASLTHYLQKLPGVDEALSK